MLTTDHIISLMKEAGWQVAICGSQVTCDPPPGPASDTDYIVLVPSAGKLSALVDQLDQNGFKWEGGGAHYQDIADVGFMSFRRKMDGEHTNFIVTKSGEFFARHRLATAICKALNLQNKAHRIILFQAILYGTFYTGDKNGAIAAKLPRISEQEDIPF